jgi:hypothetical protein
MRTRKPRARLYRFDNGNYGVQKRFLCFWHFLTAPSTYDPDWEVYFATPDKYKALRIVENINMEGPVDT